MNATRFLSLAASSSILAALLTSCSSGSPYGSMGGHDILLVLPPLPPSWAWLPDLRMALTWRGPDGRLRSALALPDSSMRIEVGRGIPQAILALPSSAGRGLMPAGALYPQALVGTTHDRSSTDELVLDWRGGYAAGIALALSGAGVDPWGYDLSRLADEAIDRCGDPWLFPALEAAAALATLEFRVDSIKKPPRFSVSLPAGPWAAESPFAAAIEASVPNGSGTGGCVAMLSEGLWRFLGAEGELLVSVVGEGAAVIIGPR